MKKKWIYLKKVLSENQTDEFYTKKAKTHTKSDGLVTHNRF